MSPKEGRREACAQTGAATLGTHLPPCRPLLGPLPEEEDLQSAQRDPQQRRLVPGLSALGASAGGFPSAPWGTLFLASLQLPFLEMGTRGCWLTSGMHGAFRGGRGASVAKAPTYRCTSDRPSGGHTSGGSHTWGLCLCPHSCAGSLRFHSYRSLVRPRV